MENGADFGVHGETFAHAHAVLGVDSEAVLLDGDVVFQGGLGLHEARQGQLGRLQPLLEDAHGLPDLAHLALQTETRGNTHVNNMLNTRGMYYLSYSLCLVYDVCYLLYNVMIPK